MLASIAALALAFTPHAPNQPKAAAASWKAPVVVGPEVDPSTPVSLSLSFQLTHQDELTALRKAQLTPGSAQYRQWLTPEEFGARFGQPPELIARTVQWLKGAGFETKVYSNNRFITASGAARQVKSLLGVTLNTVKGAAASVHVPNQKPVLPAWLSPQLIGVLGLDTRIKAHPRLFDSYGSIGLGPQDIRAEYDENVLIRSPYEFYGQGQQLVVLGVAEPAGSDVSPANVNYFYQNVSNASVQLVETQIMPINGDYDTGSATFEMTLDVEMQSVGSPGADTINLVEAPASQIFAVGPEYIVANYPKATAVSISFGSCELAEDPTEAASMETAVIQGTVEGQTWSAASGDNGADDCGDGQTAAVDFPGVLPEIVSMGGSEIVPITWNRYAAITAHQTEEVWNNGEVDAGILNGFGAGAAGGGGISTIYPAPDYQTQLGFTSRSVPDVSLIAGIPNVILVDSAPGTFDIVEGTSIASPLSAGFFGAIASANGCRLGDPHSVLYAAGLAQFDGGAATYNDITSGDNSINGVTGFPATVGYDSASGWGSMNVFQLAAYWPLCNREQADAGWGTNGGGFDDGGTNGPSYDQCTVTGCATGTCTNLTDGPSSCQVITDCDSSQDDAGHNANGQCPSNTTCLTSGPYAGDGDGGACAPGCFQNNDCDAGSCNQCYDSCQSAGKAGAKIGDGCSTDSDCGPGGTCITGTSFGVYFDGGYCSSNCNPFSVVCADLCTTGSNNSSGSCQPFGPNFFTCLETCTTNADCTRPGYICQPQTSYCGDGGFDFFGSPNSAGPCPSVCEPGCQIVDAGPPFGIYNTCVNVWGACDPSTGLCTIVDGGGVVITPTPTTGGTTGGITTTGTATGGTAGATGGAITTGGTGTGGVAATGGTGGSTGATGKSTTGGTGKATGGTTGKATGGKSTTGGTGKSATTGGASTTNGTSNGTSSSGGTSGTTPSKSGCSCSPGTSSPDVLFGLFGLVLLARRRKVGASRRV